MHKMGIVVLPLLAVALLRVGYAHPAQPSQPVPSTQLDDFTAVTVQPLGSVHQLMHGTDGKYYLVYELELTNTKPAPATIQRVDIVDASTSGRVIASYNDTALVDRLVTLHPAPANSAVIAPDASRLLYVELAFDDLATAPRAIQHQLQLLGAANPGTTTPTALQYTVARMHVSHEAPVVLGPPLAGPGWVATNGCCNSMITHPAGPCRASTAVCTTRSASPSTGCGSMTLASSCTAT